MEDGMDGGTAGGPKQATDADRLVGLRIAALRKARGMSQSSLGQAIGVTFQQVRKYEHGVNRLSVGRLHAIAALLEVSTADLIAKPSGTDAGPKAETLSFLCVPGAVDLLRAFAAIKNNETRRGLINLARAIATRDDGSEAPPEA